MKRRTFLHKATWGLAGTPLLSACSSEESSTARAPAVQTQPNIRWRLVSSFPRGLDTIYGAAEVLSERVREMTDGRFIIRPYPAGEIVPGLQVMDAVQQGTAQMGHTASYYFIGKHPAFAFDCTVPFGLTPRMVTAWKKYGGGQELLRDLYADFNLISLSGGNTGIQMGGWFKREIRSIEDLKGLKMRIPGLGGEVMSRMGVTVQVLAGGDIFPALERGVIDATEWVGPYDDEKLGFHKIARYYYYPGWWEPGPELVFYVNSSAWNQLPRTYQEILQTAAWEAHVTMMAAYDAKNPPALKRLLEGGVQLRAFPEDVMRTAYQISFELFDDFAAQDPLYRKIYESWRAFRKDIYQWFSTAELSYAAFAFPLH